MSSNPPGLKGLTDGELTVLHVDDDRAFAALTADRLEHEDKRFTVTTETSARDGLDALERTNVDCIVSDYDMPRQNGLEFLDAVREQYPELPFILFTGKGSEEIASEAISAGVTDYLQKEANPEQYELLARRVTNAVTSHRARTNYREILENVPDGIVVQDPETGEILDMNAEYCALFDYSRETLLDAGFEAIHPGEPPYTLENARKRIREAIGNQPQTFEWPGVTKHGDRIWTEVHLRPTQLDGKRRILAVVRDISDRKERERTLQYERNKLAGLFEAAPEPVVHVRLESGDPVVQRVNDAFSDVFGLDRPEAEGNALDKLIIPDQSEDQPPEQDQQLLAGSGIEQTVVRETTSGNQEFRFKAATIRQQDEPFEWVGMYTDIKS